MVSRLRQVLLRTRLHRSAQRFAAHGWSVAPGGYLNGERIACDRPTCWATSCHPVLPEWEQRASTQPGHLAEWWRAKPHAVLLPTGQAFDAIEVPALLGATVSRLTGPVAVVPGPGPGAQRWIFLTQPGLPLFPELNHRPDVVRHSSGSWIPAPPTVLVAGAVRWRLSPEQVQWHLPDPAEVQTALIRGLVALDAAFLDLPVTAWRRIAPRPMLATSQLDLR